jgi:malate dehydrogenase (oxaloacetate-decarboxylating)(NADP+)
MPDDFKTGALEYHRASPAGKLQVVATKPLATQRDLALAYTPGVAYACEAIVADPAEARTVTARGNLVAVVTNGTAVLGLGAIGPLAAKPVMEGKAVLFKKFAAVDVFDIEVNETDPDKLVDIIAALEPSFGGINLEDIKAPECFVVEEKLRRRMKIPVFHDDQHGTAIIVGAAVKNGLEVVGKTIAEAKLVVVGAGAAALACIEMLLSMGLKRENVVVCDLAGVVYQGRAELMDPYKAAFATKSKLRKTADAFVGADIFLGLSGPNAVSREMIASLAPRPLVFALANPTPEIMPDVVKEVRPDAVIATGRSDYPNQVNNVLCFPYLFRGALDVGATAINEAMKLAAVDALAALAKQASDAVEVGAYGGEATLFGPEHLIPRPFDPRLLLTVPPAVAKAAMESGVATQPIADLDAYRQHLAEFVFRSGLVMKPVFDRARIDPRRVVYAEGEERRVLHAVQVVLDEGLAKPILIGRPAVVAERIARLGLRIAPGRDFTLVDPENDPRFREYWTLYHGLVERSGVTPYDARAAVRTNPTLIAALMVQRGEADVMIAGTTGVYERHLRPVLDVIGLAPGVGKAAALSMMITAKGTYFLVDTYVTGQRTPREIAEMTVRAAAAVRRFGVEPKAALLSHSNFGASDSESARRMREALPIVRELAPEIEIEGEMHADAALNEELRLELFPNSRLKGAANLLILPSLDAAHISLNILKVLGDGLPVGPMLLGSAKPAHILSPSVTARGIVNMTAVAVVDGQDFAARG